MAPEGVAAVGAMHATNDDLALLAGMVADGRLTLPIEAVLPLEAVGEGYARLASGHLRGKVVVTTG